MTFDQAERLTLLIDNLVDAKLALRALDDECDPEVHLQHCDDVETLREDIFSMFLNLEAQ